MTNKSIYPNARFLAATLAALSSSTVWAQAPSNLKITSATSKQVAIGWSGTAASYTVQRAPLGGLFSTIGTVTTSTYTDTTIDAYSTYQYQVLNGTAASAAATVGPPPFGVTNAAQAPLVGTTPSTTYGVSVSAAFDGNGDPAILFLWDDPTATGDHSTTQLLFRSWNRVQYSWNPVVKVATVGDVATTDHAVVSLAYDTSTNTFSAISESVSNGSIVLPMFVSSDGGATWTLKNTFRNGTNQMAGPSLALRQGNFYLAYEVDTVGLTYVTGQLSQPANTWTTKQQPPFTGTDLASWSTGPSLALDSAGNPGIAYWALDSTGSNNGALLFWRPAGTGGPVKITDSQGNGDGTAVKLLFSNLNPRVAMWVIRKDSGDGQGVHFAHSENGGTTWATPVLTPADGNSTTDFPFDMALDSRGNVAIAFGQNGNTGDDSHKCGNPKLSLSTDLTHFTTCSFADPSVTGNFAVYPAGLQDLYGGNDKLYLLWLDASDTATNSGVLMYREPPAGAITGPTISSVGDAVIVRPNIVAGSWVAIKGVNLSSTTRIWGQADFNNGISLPTLLDGVSVKINGLAAAVYYISPTQIDVQAPSPLNGQVPVQVTHNGVTSNIINANAVANAPTLFTYTAGTKTYPSAYLINGLIVGDPSVSGSIVGKAKAGDIIQLYATGIGASPAGTILSGATPFAGTVTATIGGTNASVQFAGVVATGEFQVNVIVPSLSSGEYPLVLTAGGQTSQPGVVVPVQ